MVPTNYRDFITTLKELVDAGRVPLARIDDAVRRILRQKARFGLWEHPFADRRADRRRSARAAHRAVARQAVRESLVLLKNERDVLPLAQGARASTCAGAEADDIGAQCGGWTVGWQGKRGPTTPGTTLLERPFAAPPAPARRSPSRGDGAGPTPRAPTSTWSWSARSPTPRGAAIAPSPS